ncbi:MAG: caspase domain-containing protein [Saprospiraceae bacterium]
MNYLLKQSFTTTLLFIALLSTTSIAQTSNALIIGINDYEQIGENLKSPINDAEELKELLKNKYDFSNIRLLKDGFATKENIFKCIENFQNELTENDQLLIFYSGLAIENENQGYWLPANIKVKEDYASLISTNTISEELDKMKCQQTLVITNAYFGYNNFEPSDFFHKLDANSTNSLEAIADINQFKGRQIITSGGIQPILDEDGIHSEFGLQLLTFLENPNQMTFDAFSLYEYLTINTENIPSKPEIGHLKNINHEGGQFVFSAKEESCELEIKEGKIVSYYDKGVLTAISNCRSCSYEWYLNDKIISHDKEVTVSNSNTYKVIMTNYVNCKVEKDIEVVIEKEKMIQSDPMDND